MRSNFLIYRLATLVTWCAFSPSAWGETTRVQQCLQAHESGQRLHKTGDLLEAGSRFAFCASPLCPPVMQKDCEARLGQVEAATPSLVLSVAFEGEAVPVRVSIDGQGRAWTPTANRLAVNPGRHELRVEAEGFAPQGSRFLLRQGQKELPLSVVFEAQTLPVKVSRSAPGVATAPQAADTVRATPTAAILLSAGGLVAAGGFTYFGLQARNGERELAQRCAPSCSDVEVGAVRRSYLLANLSLGLSAASLLGGGILFWVHSADDDAADSTQQRVALHVNTSAVTLFGEF